jgi:hypothetical protein
VLGLGGLGAGTLNEPEAGTPTEDEQRQHDAGDNHEGQLYTGAREHPESHSSDDRAQPHSDPRGESVRVPPGASDQRPQKAAGEKRPRGVSDTEEVGCLLVAAASDDRKDQDADHIHRNRWKDLHEPHTTLRPWLPQAIVTSPLLRARTWLPA